MDRYKIYERGFGMIRKIILFVGDIETLDYFSRQLGNAFTKKGYKIFYFDFAKEEKSLKLMRKFIDIGETVMVTFNFIGISAEEILYSGEGVSVFDTYEIPCYNIVVDHPFYYHKHYPLVPANYTQLSIDRLHHAFMERFYPEIHLGGFLPLAGTGICPLDAPREMDVVFTGNYTPPASFNKPITRINDEYTAFYHSILDELIRHPSRDIAEVFLEFLQKEMPDISDKDAAECMSNMIFLDLYIRFHFRGEIIRMLVDNGIRVDVFGEGWTELPVKHPENLIIHGGTNSVGCLKNIGKAKISLNIMPWFKDGAHDRIFNSMLNGGVCLSDDSKYLREILSNGKHIIFYSLEKIEALPAMVKRLLDDPELLSAIREEGFLQASKFHTWAHRADYLETLF